MARGGQEEEDDEAGTTAPSTVDTFVQEEGGAYAKSNPCLFVDASSRSTRWQRYTSADADADAAAEDAALVAPCRWLQWTAPMDDDDPVAAVG